MAKKRNLKMWLVMAVFLVGMVPAIAAGVTIYVDADASVGGDGQSWATAYKYLQDGLAAAVADDEIWVAEGTYKPDEDEGGNVTLNDRIATFQLINGVGMYGGFTGSGSSLEQRDWQTKETILSGDLLGDDGLDFANNSDNSYHVVTGSGTDETAVLDGFTITAGNANGGGTDNYGGGMFNTSGSPTVTNCTFSNNSAVQGGGMCNYESSPAVTNCTFTGNSADLGGGMYNQEFSSPTVTNCTFSNNSAGGGWPNRGEGGGMYNVDNSSPTVTNCTFSGNSAAGYGYGGGMFNLWYSNPTLTNCTFNGNSADFHGGGMCNYESSPTLTNCTFSENSAGAGGGMTNRLSSNPTVTNCTFSGNTASSHGGGMWNHGFSNPTVNNCIFSGNSAGSGGGGMFNWSYSSPTLTNCTFSGNSATNGGGMYNLNNSSPTLTNCTFSGNSAGEWGGGMWNYWFSNPTLTNCILWGDSAPTGPEIFNDGTISATVSYCDVQGSGGSGAGWNLAVGTDGGNNIDDNPLFMDADGPDNIPGTEDDNLRLLPGSPCIDAGDNSAVPAGVTTDLDGNPRFVDDLATTDTGNGTPPIVDMGAYEGPIVIDSDNDGLSDEDEVVYGTNPDNPDTDADGLMDGTEVDMADGSGCPDPLNPDSDGDTLLDGDEVDSGTNPCNVDTDGDGLTDDIDPYPLDPEITNDVLEQMARTLCAMIRDLNLALFNGPNNNANKGRRNALANRACGAANGIGDGNIDSAVASLMSLLDKVDDADPPPDWMDESSQKTNVADLASQLIVLLSG